MLVQKELMEIQNEILQKKCQGQKDHLLLATVAAAPTANQKLFLKTNVHFQPDQNQAFNVLTTLNDIIKSKNKMVALLKIYFIIKN